MAVYLVVTLDTKGAEAGYLKDQLEARGIPVILVDVGSSQPPTVAPDVSREDVLRVGDESDSLQFHGQDRGQAVAAMTRAIAKYLLTEHQAKRLHGVISLGGSAGTSIGTSGMRALPIGVPKLMVSTMASGQVRPYVGDKDLLMMNSIVDFAGLNRISRLILQRAADAMAGLAGGLAQRPTDASTQDDRPLIAATMFGVTTPCVQTAKTILEQAGYEVLVFHATGTGGQAMETLIRDGLLAGVLDLTTTELADELVGGVLTAGPNRLTAAAQQGIPQVVSVGALDMVNFGARETVPTKFAHRKFYQHNPVVTLMRTTPDECRTLGREIGRKLSGSTGPCTVLFPERGVSAIDAEGQPFDDPQARKALAESLRAELSGPTFVSRDRHINDPEFAREAAETLLTLLQAQPAKP